MSSNTVSSAGLGIFSIRPVLGWSDPTGLTGNLFAILNGADFRKYTKKTNPTGEAGLEWKNNSGTESVILRTPDGVKIREMSEKVWGKWNFPARIAFNFEECESK